MPETFHQDLQEAIKNAPHERAKKLLKAIREKYNQLLKNPDKSVLENYIHNWRKTYGI